MQRKSAILQPGNPDHFLKFSQLLLDVSFLISVLKHPWPMDANFGVAQMRKHVLSCLENQHLSPFPKALKEEH